MNVEVMDNNTAEKLKQYMERLVRLEQDKQDIATDIKELYAEAKNFGFDTKAMRKILSIMKKDRNKQAEEEAILETYLAALGMI